MFCLEWSLTTGRHVIRSTVQVGNLSTGYSENAFEKQDRLVRDPNRTKQIAPLVMLQRLLCRPQNQLNGRCDQAGNSLGRYSTPNR